MLPMAKPGLISITIFNILGQWNQYLLPIVLLPGDAEDKWVHHPGHRQHLHQRGLRGRLARPVRRAEHGDHPGLIVYIIFQRQIQAGLTAGAVK